MFEDEKAHEKHVQTVTSILENEIIAPLKRHPYLNLMSKAERESRN